jgi:hypothetical protein
MYNYESLAEIVRDFHDFVETLLTIQVQIFPKTVQAQARD